MGTPKFSIGELAIFTGAGATTSPAMAPYVGQKVEVYEHRGISRRGHIEYGVRLMDGDAANVVEPSLEKIPPANDSLQHFRSELKPCDDLYRKRLEPILNPVSAELEASARRIHPSLSEIQFGGRS